MEKNYWYYYAVSKEGFVDGGYELCERTTEYPPLGGVVNG